MTILRIIFLAALSGGLVLAVFAMLHGVEHMRRNRSHAPSPFINLPAIAAFAVGFGATGYPLASRTRLPSWAMLLIAIGGGALAITAMITLLARRPRLELALDVGNPGSARDSHARNCRGGHR